MSSFPRKTLAGLVKNFKIIPKLLWITKTLQILKSWWFNLEAEAITYGTL